MKIIDDKGRLFGIINIVDLIVVLVVLLFAGGMYFKFVAKESVTQKKHLEEEILVTIKYKPMDEGELEGVKPGEQLIANDALQPIFVEKVEVRTEKAVLEENGRLIEVEHPYEKNIYITIKGKASIGDVNIHMANQIIRIGREFFLKTLTTEWKGTVTHIDME